MTAVEAGRLPARSGAGVLADRFRAGFGTDVRRVLQLVLACVWLLDGILQYQGFMFTTGFGAQVLAPVAQGNPGWIADSVAWSAGIVAANPVWTNAAFATIQLLLGLGLALRITVKPALAASIVWSALVWWFGEGLGGLLSGAASPLTGAPGAVLLYALVAVLLWPGTTPAPAATLAPGTTPATGSFAAAGLVGAKTAKVMWFVLWGGFAALALQPANLAPHGIGQMLTGMASGQPAWVAAPVNAFAALTANHGVPFTLAGAAILALIAAGIFLPPRWARATVVTALAVSVFIWVVGEALGCLFGGQATDPNTGPLLILISCAYWPAGSAAAGSGDRPRVSVRPAARAAHLDIDACNVVMLAAMAAMLIPGLGLLASGPAATVWMVVFATAAAWFTVRVVAGLVRRRHGFRSAGHHLPHLVLSCAMVYMLLASTTLARTLPGMSGMAGRAGMPGMPGAAGSTPAMAQFPTLALVFGLFAFGYAVLSIDRLARPAVAGAAFMRTAVTGTVMALAMGYMLIMMLG